MGQPETRQPYRGNLDKLTAKVLNERGLDLGQYRQQYLERRIATRLRSLDLHSYRQYVDYLDTHADEYAKLIDTLTINVTEFYRDAPVFDLFRKTIVPAMIENKLRARQRMLRAWSAGCATGEEPYSIAMSFLDGLGSHTKDFVLTVIATDLDDRAIAQAKAAVYPAERLKTIPKTHQVKYLDVHGDTFSVKPEVARHVRFRHFNLFADKPISVVDVIFCRNVFIYFSREQQEKVLEMFWGALAKGGYLVLGRSEKLAPSAAKRFELVSGRERVYRKPPLR
ncbi:MAG: CheR family methyltransferase [Actinomycetota bacterium]|nr:CheR family methyltransferase [Actinomycetota bacterium]